MNASNAGPRADVPQPPVSQMGAGVRGGTTFVPLNAPNNPSRDNKGDAVGNAVSSVLEYVFEVLPGRATGALMPVASDAQARTPQLMASVHAQDAVEANRLSWDSVAWVRAGDVLAAGFERIEGVVAYVAEHAPSLHIGPAGAESAPTARTPMSLLELDTCLSEHFTLEKSRGLQRYEKAGGVSADELIIFIPDPDHRSDRVQSLLDATLSKLVQADLGDRVLLENVGWQYLTDAQLQERCRGIPRSNCDFFRETPSVDELLTLNVKTRDAFIHFLVWLGDHVPAPSARTLEASLRQINFGKTQAVSLLIVLVNEYQAKVNPDARAEMEKRFDQADKINVEYQSKVQAMSQDRSNAYVDQVAVMRAAMPKGAKLVTIQGSSHYDESRKVILSDTKQRYLIANMKMGKDDL